jgi:hypothetical protein
MKKYLSVLFCFSLQQVTRETDQMGQVRNEASWEPIWRGRARSQLLKEEE